jgi:hypothetical protein
MCVLAIRLSCEFLLTSRVLEYEQRVYHLLLNVGRFLRVSVRNVSVTESRDSCRYQEKADRVFDPQIYSYNVQFDEI